MTEEERMIQTAVDVHLRAATFLEAQMGTDSTPEEREVIEAKKEKHYQAIKLISEEHYIKYNKET